MSDIFKTLSETLSLNLENVSLSIDDAKDLFNLNDKDFAKQYLLSKGAKIKEKKLSSLKPKKEIKPCFLGKAGDQNRKEIIDLIKNVIIDDPLRENFKTGYDKAAILLNKNGYRTFNKKKWTHKSVANFWYHITVRSKQNTSIHQPPEKKVASSSSSSSSKVRPNQVTNMELISQVLFSNLDSEIKLILTSILMDKGNDTRIK